jgi:hypothetical protein
MMKRLVFFLALLLALSACGRLDAIPYDPPQTPETWLQIQPYARFTLGGQEITLMQPSTTAIVYLLGLLTIGIGLYFLRIRAGQRSRLWWGVALLLWGLGALLAGTSYEAFSYAIKCAGRAACLWTSWWEIAYLLTTVWSIDAMTLAVAHASTTGKLRQILTVYAYANALVYLVLLLIGVYTPVKALISFEFLLAVGAPSFLAFFAINTWRYTRYKLPADLVGMGAWLWLAVTVAAYFLYYLSGLTNTLWAKGLWFSENDVLHICLIVWMLYIAFALAPRTTDISLADDRP